MDSPLHTLRYLLFLIGFFLVATGGLLLLWFGNMVVQIVTEPEQVRIIQYIMEHISTDGPLLYGSSANSEFELNLSDSGKTFGFFVLGVFALGVLAGIVKALLSGGVEIIKGAMAMQPGSETDDNPRSGR